MTLLPRQISALLAAALALAIFLPVYASAAQPAEQSPAATATGKNAVAATAQKTASSPGAPASATTVSADAALAAQIRDLVAGRVDDGLAPDALFRFSLDDNGPQRLRAVERLTHDAAFFAAASADHTKLAPLSSGQAQLALAQAAFLRLPESRRQERLKKLREAYAKQTEAQRTHEAQAKTLSDLIAQIAGLDAFLAGKPVALGQIDINLDAGSRSPSQALTAIAGSDKNTGANTGSQGATGTAPAARDPQDPGPDAPVADRIAWARNVAARRWHTVLTLPSNRFEQLRKTAEAQSADADAIATAQAQLDAANAQLDQARKAAVQAGNARDQLLASERTALLQTRRTQAEFRTRLARSAGEAQGIHDDALEWRAKVEALKSGKNPAASDADTLYAALVTRLGDLRARLRKSLDSSGSAPPALDPAPLDPALGMDSPQARALHAQRQSLIAQAMRLRDQDTAQLDARRAALHAAMILLNRERLGLIPRLSSEKRRAVTGFGADGVAQVRRELSEITLDVRFYVQSWRTIASQILNGLLYPSPAYVLSLLRLLAIAAIFHWWRRHGAGVLMRAQGAAARRRPRTLLLTIEAALIEYWRRVRGPLDRLVLALLVWWLWPEELAIPGLALLWIVLFWTLVTMVVVRLVNELARGRGHDDPRAALRWNSLRLIAGGLLVVGLLMELAAASVGEGAIFNWIRTLAWLGAAVVVLLLAHWWRERIVTLARSEARESAFLGWIGRDPGGIAGLLGRVIAGGLLLLRGVRAIIARRVRDLALVREIFEQRARAQAERQVAQDKASGRFQRLPDSAMAVLDPHRPPTTPVQERRGATLRPGSLTLPRLAPGTLTLLVGERGLGKSALLRDIAAQARADTDGACATIQAAIDARGFAGLLDDLATGLAPEESPAAGTSPTPTGVAALLHAREKPALILIDDIQRLVVPAIGGLDALDALVSLARECGGTSHWIFSIGEEAWNYLRRARADRILFDTVTALPRWSATDLRALIERRTAQAGIDPDFAGMVDEGVFELGEHLSVEERKRRGYFERLAAEVNGNPAVGLDYWRHSLFVDSATGQVSVRTFDKPALDRLAAMPLPTRFVLRAIVQMDLGDAATIQKSTDLPAFIVADALRGLERLGVVVREEQGYRVALYWWVEVIRLLARQNLIVRSAI